MAIRMKMTFTNANDTSKETITANATRYKKVYEKNKNYDPEKMRKAVAIHRAAKAIGDMETMKAQNEIIYAFLENYVYKVLSTNFGRVMRDKWLQKDIVNEVWVTIFEHIDRYDADKGSPTTFVFPWIKHVIGEVTSAHYRKTTPYFAGACRKIQSAQNYCETRRIEASVSNICRLTGLPLTTVNRGLKLILRANTQSLEALTEADGVSAKGSTFEPEREALINEKNEAIRGFLASLTPCERLVAYFRANPLDDIGEKKSDKLATYAEIAARLKEMGYTHREDGRIIDTPTVRDTVEIVRKKCAAYEPIREYLPRGAFRYTATKRIPIYDEAEDPDDILEQFTASLSGLPGHPSQQIYGAVI